MGSPYSAAERAAWAPPEDHLSGTEWAERYRVLGSRVTSEPGPYSAERTPYARGIMDALADREHQEVVLRKGVQIGGSEVGRNAIGRWVDVAPGPVMVVFPNEAMARETITERVLPMLEDSPRLRALLTGRAWDVKTGQITLRPCTIYIGWSGSATALASRPIRYLVLDEVDKYSPYRGVEASAIELAKDRTLTYAHRRKVYLVSTPTTPLGAISRAYDACGDRRHYHVPCVRCGALIRPDWERVQWRGKDSSDPDEIVVARAELEARELVAAVVCPECEYRHADRAWARQVRRGQWVSEGWGPGEHPHSESVGFQLPSLVSPWVGPQRMAVEYASALLKGVAEMQNFYNAYLGLPFWDASVHGDSTTRIGAATVWQRAEAAVSSDVPEWTVAVLAGVDSKGRAGHQYVVRAYGRQYRSRLLAYGETATSDEMHEILRRPWIDERGREHTVRRACVDVGGAKGRGRRDQSRTDEVYRWCATDPAHLWAVRGLGGSGSATQQVTTSVHTYAPPGRKTSARDVKLSTIDTTYFKDLLASLVLREDPVVWELMPGVCRDYVLQICSEQKVLVETRVRQGERTDIWRWVPRTSRSTNHYWDCEVYCLVAAYMLGLGRDAPAPEVVEQRAARWRARSRERSWMDRERDV